MAHSVASAERRRAEEALPIFARALELRPAYAEVHNNLGNALRSLGRVDEAVACYERALQLKPAYAEAHNNLGCELAAKGRTTEAIYHLEQAVRLNPGNSTNHNNLGNALRDAGRSFLVITHYQRLLDHIKPDVVHIMAAGRIIKTGGPELALEVENNGYAMGTAVKRGSAETHFYRRGTAFRIPGMSVNGMDVPMVFSWRMNLICCDLLLCDIRVMIPAMTFPPVPASLSRRG